MAEMAELDFLYAARRLAEDEKEFWTAYERCKSKPAHKEEKKKENESAPIHIHQTI